jgi:hypothetical protein
MIEKLLGHLLGNAPFSIRSMPRYVRRTRRIRCIGEFEQWVIHKALQSSEEVNMVGDESTLLGAIT